MKRSRELIAVFPETDKRKWAEARKQPRPLKDTPEIRPLGNNLGSSGGLFNRGSNQL